MRCMPRAAVFWTVKLLIGGLCLINIAEGVTCPPRTSYQPALTVGNAFGGTLSLVYNASTTYHPSTGRPSNYVSDCCPTGRIVSWSVTATVYGWVGKVQATCSDGTVLRTVFNTSAVIGAGANPPVLDQFGYGGYVNGSAEICNFSPTGNYPGLSNQTVTIYQPDNEGLFNYDATDYTLDVFMTVGSNFYSNRTGTFSCPTGTRAIGFGTRSGCFSLTNFNVICAKTNSTQNNTAALQPNTSCSTSPSTAYQNQYLGNPSAWNSSSLGQYSAAAGPLVLDCCDSGAVIANWSTAMSEPLGAYNYVGLLQAQCTDNSLLQPVVYGYNGTGQYCGLQQIYTPQTYNAPRNSSIFYYLQDNALTSLFKSQSDYYAISCLNDQVAIGYAAQSSCFSLANVTVFCGKGSQAATSQLAKIESAPTNPPHSADDGLCPTGVAYVPFSSHYYYYNVAIGRSGPWSYSFANNQVRQGAFGTTTYYAGQSSPFQSFCCPANQVLTAFNIWPTATPMGWVGQLQGVCANTTLTGNITYGFNGTDASGSPIICNSSSLGSSQQRQLLSQSWVIASHDAFETLLSYPAGTNISTASNSVTNTYNCPTGLSPMGFGAYSSCLSLSGFRMICGNATITSISEPVTTSGSGANGTPSSSGISSGGIAGIAIGAVAGVLLAILAFAFAYRRHQAHKKRTQIESHRLFDMGGSEGFFSAPHDKLVSSDSAHSVLDMRSVLSSLKSGEMTIANLGEVDEAATAFEGIPKEWRIEPNEIRLYCVEDKPVELGRGGFGCVLYGVAHRADCALKIISSKQRDKQAALLQEMNVMEKARSDFVVRFLGYSVCKEGIILAMEFLAGGTLYQALRRNNEYQWYNRGAQAIRDVAKGLYSLHQHRVAHLDCKSSNVLITETGRCKVSDLGLGRLLDHEETRQLTNQQGYGTWVYMPPEMFEGRVGFACDVWAFSTIMWEVCTLAKPDRDIWGTAQIRVPQDAPQELVDLIVSCRQDDPKLRPTIGTVCDILDSIEDQAIQESLKI